MLALAIGGLGSTLGGWIAAGRGLAGPASLLATAVGRLLFDGAVWLVLAGLLGLAAAVVGAGRGAPAGGVTATSEWLVPLAVAGAQRVYVAPLLALARLTGWRGLGSLARPAVWLWALAVLYLAVRDRCGSPRQAKLVLLGGVVLPLALVIVGAALTGLGWLWAPLLPDGFSPGGPL